MLSLTITSIRANKARFLLTGVAIMLGVAFMAGTFVLTDTIKQSYDDVAGNVYESTDAVVRAAGHVASTNGGTEVRGTLPAAMLEAVRATPGVRTAEAEQSGIALILAHDGSLLDANPNRSIPVALGWQQSPELNPMEIVSGHAPRAPNDVVIDGVSFAAGHYALGETVRVVSQSGTTELRLAGVVTYGGASRAAGNAQVVAFTPETAARVLGTAGRYNAIEVVADPGVSQARVVANLRSRLPHGVEAITGADATAEARQANGTGLEFMNMFLMTFALVALVVGSFVIYNTFSITVAQRTKETALLRAIGAKRRQVTRSVLLEALFSGVVASAAGALAGIGTAQGLRWVLGAFSVELPDAATVVRPSAVVIAMTTGVAVTVVSAYLPARRAAKVAPIEALRDVAVDRSGSSKRRIAAGAVLTIAGAAFIAQGLSGAGVGPVGLGAFAVFAGVSLLGPSMVPAFVGMIGWPLPRLRGTAGRLARQNAMRNPRRTSATASSLMIGVGLVALITVFAASMKASVATDIDRAMKSDWIVDTQWGMGGLSPVVTQRIDALAETAPVTALRFTNATVDGKATDVSAFDPVSAVRNVEFDLRSGEVSRMGAHDVAVQEDTANAHGIHVGDTVTMVFPETGAQRLHVSAVYGTKDPFGPYALSIAGFDANVATRVDNDVLVSRAPGYSLAETRAAVERVLRDFPNATLHTKAEFKGSIADQIDQVLNLVYVLLGMALLIALFGIANTLALSVFERTREIGLLRAIGMARAQVRSTVRWESVLIALLGTTLGTGIGLGFAWALIRAAGDIGVHGMTVPVTPLALIVAGAALAAVVTAALPARRAARLDVLRAIQQ